MNDLALASFALEGHTIALAKGHDVIVSDLRGISPLMEMIENGFDLKGYSLADQVVGKAAAFLFVKVGVKECYAKVISEKAMETLRRFNIPCRYDNLVPYIINRSKTGMCPMEETVLLEEDPVRAYELLKAKWNELRNGK